jgi:hypothetical protein
MKKQLFMGLVALGLSTSYAFSQENFQTQVNKIAKQIQHIKQEQKEALVVKIDKINHDLDKGIITAEEATQRKKEAQAYHAKQIEEKVNAESEKLSQCVQDKANGLYPEIDELASSGEERARMVHPKVKKDDSERDAKQFKLRLDFGMGLNQITGGGAKMIASHYYHGGFGLDIRLIKDNPLYYANVGIDYVVSNLRPYKNEHFQQKGELTQVVKSDFNLDEHRLRMASIEIPAMLMLDFSPLKKVEKNGETKSYIRANNSWRFGLGGFVGFNTSVKNILSYTSNNQDIVATESSNFNVNPVYAGLSAMVGYSGINLYAKYHLTPLFQSPNPPQELWSIGIKLIP